MRPDEPKLLSLWFRETPRYPWREVATAPTSAELTAKLKDLPSGESIVLRQGEHPDQRRRG